MMMAPVRESDFTRLGTVPGGTGGRRCRRRRPRRCSRSRRARRSRAWGRRRWRSPWARTADAERLAGVGVETRGEIERQDRLARAVHRLDRPSRRSPRPAGSGPCPAGRRPPSRLPTSSASSRPGSSGPSVVPVRSGRCPTWPGCSNWTAASPLRRSACANQTTRTATSQASRWRATTPPSPPLLPGPQTIRRGSRDAPRAAEPVGRPPAGVLHQDQRGHAQPLGRPGVDAREPRRATTVECSSMILPNPACHLSSAGPPRH